MGRLNGLHLRIPQSMWRLKASTTGAARGLANQKNRRRRAVARTAKIARMSASTRTAGGEDTRIRAAEQMDATRIAEIYNHYVNESIITFEEEPITAPEIARRLAEVRYASLPWLVAEDSNRVTGYAYATPWKSRSAYRFSVESTVYVAPEWAGRGIGSLLYGQLIPLLRAQHIHTAIGGIALPNAASVALHEKFEFRKVAHFEQVGFKFNRWIDVGYWQRRL